MTWHAAGLRRLDGIIWLLVAVTAGLDLIAAAFGTFSIVLASCAAPAGTCLMLVLAARYYGGRRNEPKLASSLEATSQMIAFAAVGAPLSYVAASAGLPLQDAMLDSMDRALGFDWRALFAIVEPWPAFCTFMRVIYLSLTVQMVAIVLLLGFTGRLPWLRVYMLAFIFAALITIVVSVFLPAEGAWIHYGLKATESAALPASHTSWPVFHGLRDGTYRQVMAIGSEGIITFPSLHAALAVILIAAFWPLPIARWLGAGVNSLMLAATPIDGSHYLIDVLAGTALAILCLAAARLLVARMTAPPETAVRAEVAPAGMATRAP